MPRASKALTRALDGVSSWLCFDACGSSRRRRKNKYEPDESITWACAEPYRFSDDRVGEPIVLLQFEVKDRDASGLWVWLAGHTCARWLCSQEGSMRDSLSSGMVAIDLGAGPGLTSLVIARLGVQRVIATDGDEDAIVHCTANVEANKLQDRVLVRQLLWGCDTAAAERVLDEALHGGAEAAILPRLLIIGTDVTYDIEELDSLHATICDLVRLYHARSGKAVEILLAWQVRANIETILWQKLSKDGEGAIVFSSRVSTGELIGETAGMHTVQIGRMSA